MDDRAEVSDPPGAVGPEPSTSQSGTSSSSTASGEVRKEVLYIINIIAVLSSL